MTRPGFFLEPRPRGLICIEARVTVDGVGYRARRIVDEQVWQDPDIREVVEGDLKRALADEVLDHFDVAFLAVADHDGLVTPTFRD